MKVNCCYPDEKYLAIRYKNTDIRKLAIVKNGTIYGYIPFKILNDRLYLPDKIDIIRHMIKSINDLTENAKKIKYQIKNDSLYILHKALDGKKHYDQMCYNIYNLTLMAIMDMVYNEVEY